MIKELTLVAEPNVAFTEDLLKEFVAQELALSSKDSFSIKLLKRSIDARNRRIKINVKVQAFINEPMKPTELGVQYLNVESKPLIHIIGAGPAGLFAALRCIELGFKPVIFERGKDVKARRRDLAAINKDHIVNPESNYCFGEGGAGTYSDGKLYTRSGKRGNIDKVLKTFVYHGAKEEILVDAHPHIGTNKLPDIITAIRETIIKQGGEVHFNTRLIDIESKGNELKAITVSNDKGETKTIEVAKLILATGHSARDIFELLHAKNITIEAKAFAMGVRAEHPQEIIDTVQYHCGTHDELIAKREYLPAASYSLVHQVGDRGVYSFCMCPGGIIAPCATGPEQVVTNGWSPSKRNNPYANSGIVTEIKLTDLKEDPIKNPLAALNFQKELEHTAWLSGGKTQTAPAQRLMDFLNQRISNDLPDCSYQPGIKSMPMEIVLGPLIAKALKQGFKGFGEKMRPYLTNEAVIVGVESRTSTPVRIPRNIDTLEHTQLKGLYPCGEGAGYAGGIVSAAIDGERCAEMAIAAFPKI
ncbi:MAG: FAD-binding protein [Bacteroidota bacterium]|nr:FAD-binding protein [Bacteroidota bacterium]